MPEDPMEVLAAKYRTLIDPAAFVVDSVRCVNFQPHPFTIGPRHVGLAAERYGGRLGDEVIRRIGCAALGCGRPPEEHTHDTVLFLRLARNLTNSEAAAALFAVKGQCEADKIDGFAFIDTGFRIAPPTEEERAKCPF